MSVSSGKKRVLWSSASALENVPGWEMCLSRRPYILSMSASLCPEAVNCLRERETLSGGSAWESLRKLSGRWKRTLNYPGRRRPGLCCCFFIKLRNARCTSAELAAKAADIMEKSGLAPARKQLACLASETESVSICSQWEAFHARYVVCDGNYLWTSRCPCEVPLFSLQRFKHFWQRDTLSEPQCAIFCGSTSAVVVLFVCSHCFQWQLEA